MSTVVNTKEYEVYLAEVFANLRNLTNADKEQIKKNSTCLNYRSGEMVYQEGESPNGLICLVKGKVKVFKEGFAGRDWISRLVKPFEMVGYRALFADENYNASAKTIEDAVIFIIKKDTIFGIIKENSDVALNFMKLLAKELGFTNRKTVTLTQKHIRGRLAETILFLRDTYGFEEGTRVIKVYLSREDIANLSNMTASNAIRTLSTFNNERLINLDGRKIELLDEASLEKISRLG